jgi:hypothetical protein
MIRPREVNSEAVSGHFPIYLGLGVYGHGPWYVSALPSITHLRMWVVVRGPGHTGSWALVEWPEEGTKQEGTPSH